MTDAPRITEVALDPVWSVGVVTIDQGLTVPYLKIVHPRLGEITLALTRESARRMATALGAVMAQVAAPGSLN